METKCKQFNIDMIKAKLKYSNSFTVNSMGRKGGLVLIWNSDCEEDIINYSQHHIHVYVTNKDSMINWYFTALNSKQNKPWCVIGYFNKILKQDEKKSCNAQPASQMEKFISALDKCDLYDIGWKGYKFAWSNRHRDFTFTKERLDHVVANQE